MPVQAAEGRAERQNGMRPCILCARGRWAVAAVSVLSYRILLRVADQCAAWLDGGSWFETAGALGYAALAGAAFFLHRLALGRCA